MSGVTASESNKLMLAIKSHAMGGTRFKMAFFEPNIIVGQHGELFTLAPKDVDDLLRSIAEATALANQGQGHYRMEKRTCMPFTQLFLPCSIDGANEESKRSKASIYGFCTPGNRRTVLLAEKEIPACLLQICDLAFETNRLCEDGASSNGEVEQKALDYTRRTMAELKL